MQQCQARAAKVLHKLKKHLGLCPAYMVCTSLWLAFFWQQPNTAPGSHSHPLGAPGWYLSEGWWQGVP